jgi:putative endonuclease
MFYVYVIRSEKDGRFYVGMCMDLARRIREHNAGKRFSTKGYCPWKLFFAEEFPTRAAAREREKSLKGGAGKEFIKTKWSGSSAEYLPAGRQGAAANNYVLCLCDKK